MSKPADPPDIQSEEDIPFASNKSPSSEPKRRMLKNEMELLESFVNIRGQNQIIGLKSKGFTLIIVFVTILVLLCVADILISNFSISNSTLLNSLFELLKNLVSILVGFVFANNLANKS